MTIFKYSCIILFHNETYEELNKTLLNCANFFDNYIIVSSNKIQIENLVRGIDLKKITIITDDKKGPEAAINLALNYVKTDFFILNFPGDKIMFDHRDKPREIKECVYPILYTVDDGKIEIAKWSKWFLRKFSMPNINLIGAYLPTDLVKKVNGFPTELKVANDHMLILKLSSIGVSFRCARNQKVEFKKGGISTKNFELGLLESSFISGFFWSIIGVPFNLLLCIKNKGSVRIFLKKLMEYKK